MGDGVLIFNRIDRIADYEPVETFDLPALYLIIRASSEGGPTSRLPVDTSSFSAGGATGGSGWFHQGSGIFLIKIFFVN
jgi:hypothetical protein